MNLPEESIESLVMSRRFQKWVKAPSAKLDAYWHDWMAGNPERRQMAAEAREIILSIRFTDNLAEAEIDQEWDKLQQLVQTETGQQRYLWPAKSLSWYSGVAAAIICLLVCVGLLYKALDKPKLLQYATQSSEIKNITLPDGSALVLNANSTVSFAEAWDADAPREVNLTGEAYFSVRRQKNNQRFIVRTHDPYQVEVLGTTFTVLNRDNRSQVFLNSGKVRLQKNNKDTLNAIILKPGELAERQGNIFTRKPGDPKRYLAFTDRKLIFNNTPVQDIAAMLEDNYGVEIKVAGRELQQKEFTGTFPNNNINLVLQALSHTYNLEITRKGQQLYLVSRKPTS